MSHSVRHAQHADLREAASLAAIGGVCVKNGVTITTENRDVIHSLRSDA